MSTYCDLFLLCKAKANERFIFRETKTKINTKMILKRYKIKERLECGFRVSHGLCTLLAFNYTKYVFCRKCQFKDNSLHSHDLE